MGQPFFLRNFSYRDDFTWNSVSGRSVGLKPVPLQSLSELERVRLQNVAFRRMLQDCDLGCHITIPKYDHKHKKSLRQKFDSLSKEKNKDKESSPQAFGIALSQVIANDRMHKQRHDPLRAEHSDPSELMLSFLHLTSSFKRANKDLSSSNSSLSSTCETPNESPLRCTPDPAPRTRRRGGVSVDCITDLDDNQSRLLEALQLSLPVERKKRRDKKLSLNPIYRQVPRVVDLCCQHLEKYGLQTVGIFRVGSSKKRVRQLREDFDQGWEVNLDEEHSVHDVAALLKEFLRDLPDPLLTRELYTAFIHTMMLDFPDQDRVIQLLLFLLPPCNSDTLHRLLCLLSTVTKHAKDTVDKEGQEATGNKMTSLNLATIFGPNLLHKLKNSDKEFVVESLARVEESTAIISLVQRMIDTYDTLFMGLPPLIFMEWYPWNIPLYGIKLTNGEKQVTVPDQATGQICGEPTRLKAKQEHLNGDTQVADPLPEKSAPLTTVPADLQNEVLKSLLETDPDVVDYLLRRKASHKSNPDLIRPEEHLCLTGRCLSSDSIKASSGEVSPYDNNSPIFSNHRMCEYTGDSSSLSSKPRDHSSGNSSPTLSTHKLGTNDPFWDDWHELFHQDFRGHRITGSAGDASECESYGSSEGLSSHQGNNKQPITTTKTLLGGLEFKPHLPVTRSSSGPQDHRGQRQTESLLHQGESGQSGALSSENLAERTGHSAGPFFKVRTDGHSPLYHCGGLRESHISHSTPSLVKYQPQGLDFQSQQMAQQSLDSPTAPSAHLPEPGQGEADPNALEWNSERWHIWKILSKENSDALPETLV